MTVVPCESWMNRLRTIQVAGIGAIALLTVSSGLGCSQTVMRQPRDNAAAETLPPPIPATALNAHDPNPGPFGGWGSRTGAEVHEEVPMTPISPTPLEVATGPKLKVGTWNGWRMPIVKGRGAATKDSVVDVMETSAKSASTTIPMPVRRGVASDGASNPVATTIPMPVKVKRPVTPPTPVATTIPMPKRIARNAESKPPVATSIPMPKPRSTRPEQAGGMDDSVLAASRATKIALPIRHMPKPNVSPEKAESPNPVAAVPAESAMMAAADVPAPAAAAPMVVEPPASTVAEVAPSEEKDDENGSSVMAEAPIAAPETPAEVVEKPAAVIEAAPEPVSMSSNPKELPTSTEPTDPAPDFEPTNDSDSAPTPTTSAATIEPALSDAKEGPTLEVLPTAELASGAAKPEVPASDETQLPSVALPEFDGTPLVLAEAPKSATETAAPSTQPAPKTDDSMAKVDGLLITGKEAEKKASEASRIPLPMKRSRASSKMASRPKPTPPMASSEESVIGAAPREVDPDAFKSQSDAPPPIPSKLD